MNTSLDNISITVLEDGTIKIETDKISGPNHANAGQFLNEMAKIAGGPVQTARKGSKFTATQINQQQTTNQ